MADRFIPFELERWQSTWENRVGRNLAESGVHPVSVGELLEMAGAAASLDDVRLGYGWANGAPALRERIAALHGGGVSPDAVTITHGSAEANFVALWELVRPGDEVAIVMPAYMQAWGLVPMLGGRVREVWLREELGWQPDPEELGAAARETAGVVVTNPVNPTGSVLCAAARQALVDGAAESGAWILADEVYAGAELDGPRTRSLHGEAPRVVSTGSLSKAYGLPGLRLGWAVSTPTMAERLWARTDYTTISHGPLTEHLATLALDPTVRDRLLARTRALLRSNLAEVRGLADAGLVSFRDPDAGAIVWVRYDPELGGSSALAERLRRDEDLLVVPGDQFRMDGWLRIGYGEEPGALRDGLARLGRGLGGARGAREGTSLAPARSRD